MAGVIVNGTTYRPSRNGNIYGQYKDGDFQESITDLAATTIDSDTIQLSGTAPITSLYWFQYSPDNILWTDYFIGGTGVSAGAFTVDIDGLSAGQLYYFRAFIDGYDQSSNIPTATTSGASVPAAPVGFSASYLSSTSLSLTWSDASDNETGFEIERSPNGTTGWTQISTPAANAESDTDTGLTADTTYYYRLRAVNGAGNSAWVEASGTTTAPSGWEFTRSFDVGTAGQVAIGSDAFDALENNIGNTIYTTEQSSTGAQSAKLMVTAGTDGSQGFGGNIDHDTILGDGDDYWLHVKAYWPSGFNFDSDFHLKFLRVHVRRTDLSNRGFVDIYISEDRSLYFQSEVENIPNNEKEFIDDQYKIQYDTWHEFIYHVHFSAGTPRTRLWFDGTKVLDNTVARTLREAGETSDLTKLYTYWNGNAPATQHCYIDDVRASNNTLPSFAPGDA